MTQKPYVGAVVHYRDKFVGSNDPWAAIIVKVHDNTWVSLFILSPGGSTRFASHVEHGKGWDFIPVQVEMSAAAGWAAGLGG